MRTYAVADSRVIVNDAIWYPRIRDVVDNVIPYQWRVLNDCEPDAAPSHSIQNFRIAAGEAEGEFYGRPFQDSDIAKWLEAASFSLKYKDDPTLREQLRSTIDLIGRAQAEDGYLDTHYLLSKPDQKWKEITYGHELYCAGHMLEAAVAYTYATNDDAFMRIMEKYVDLISATFGREPGKIDGYPGHEEIELALMKAYELTGKEKYLRLAEYFILNRGVTDGFKNEENYHRMLKESKAYDPSYYQIHKPLLEQTTAEGHSVRAMYFYTGAAEVAMATENNALVSTLETLWRNVVDRRMYITGGLGSQSDGERFTIDYDLPNDTCYTE
ncbi:MAG: glycoside hydrolase family 127 protein, partial [Clostridia bacterium]|nr:glycoside hydrolase family 127 protein [Clostridia bacterium]